MGDTYTHSLSGRHISGCAFSGDNTIYGSSGFKIHAENGLQLALGQPYYTPSGTLVAGKHAQLCGKRLRITGADEQYDGFDISTTNGAQDLFRVFRDASGNAVFKMQSASGDPTTQNRVDFDLTLGVASFLGPAPGFAVTTGPLQSSTVTATTGTFTNLTVNGSGVQPSNANLNAISALGSISLNAMAGISGAVQQGDELLVKGGVVHTHLQANYQPVLGRISTLANITAAIANGEQTTTIPSIAGMAAYVADSGGGDPDSLILASPNGSGTILSSSSSMTVVNSFGDLTTLTTAQQMNNMKLSEILVKMFFPEVVVSAPNVGGVQILSDSIADPLVRLVGQAIGNFTVTYDSKVWSNGARYLGDPTDAHGLQIKSGSTVLATLGKQDAAWSQNTEKWVATMPSTVANLTSATVNNYDLTYQIYYEAGFATTSNTGATNYAAPAAGDGSRTTATLEWVVPIYYSGGLGGSDIERNVTHSFTNWSATSYVDLSLADRDVLGLQQYFDFPDSKSGTVVIKEFDSISSAWVVPATNRYSSSTPAARQIPAGTGNSFAYTRYTYVAGGGSGSYRGAITIRVYLS